jgi:hypothetical protein
MLLTLSTKNKFKQNPIYYPIFRLESLEMHLETRHSEKMWLVKHLERTRKQVLEDLIVVKVW